MGCNLARRSHRVVSAPMLSGKPPRSSVTTMLYTVGEYDIVALVEAPGDEPSPASPRAYNISASEPNDAFLDGVHNGLSAVVDTELVIDTGDVIAHRPRADA